ncbi:MAG: CHAP domain-containing protein [Thermomicrobiales bacterium]
MRSGTWQDNAAASAGIARVRLNTGGQNLFRTVHFSRDDFGSGSHGADRNNRPESIRLICRAAAVALVLFAVNYQWGAANPYEDHYYDDAGVWRSNCTWWAWQRWLEVNGEALPTWGNAGEWAANAQAAGYPVDATPAAGSVVVTWESPLGHVAFVEAVEPEDPNRFLVSEYGYAPGVARHERWLTTDGRLLFVHPRADPTEERGKEPLGGDGTGGP